MFPGTTCPKCGADRSAEATECPQCGIIYARYEAAQVKRREEEAAAEAARQAQLAAKQEAEERKAEVRQRAEKRRAEARQGEAVGPGQPKLIACAACGQSVSVMADACPHCGHPVDKALRMTPWERKFAQFWQWCIVSVIVFVLLGAMYCSERLSNPGKYRSAPASSPAPSRPAPAKGPNIRTNVPIAIPDDAKVVGCHDIDDYWMVEGFRRGGDEGWKENLRQRVADGRCGRVATGRGVAVEILPTGVTEIRDSSGVKWYVNDSSLRGVGAY